MEQNDTFFKNRIHNNKMIYGIVFTVGIQTFNWLITFQNHIILSGAEKVDIVYLTSSDSDINTLGTLTAVTDIGVVDIAEQPTQEGNRHAFICFMCLRAKEA